MKYKWYVIALLFLMLTACKINLYSGLGESDANEMTALLLANDIQVQKVAGAENTWTLSIDEADMVRAVALLNANGLPREKFTSLGQIFKKEGMISTPLEEKARFMFALGQEVAGTIAQIDGVLNARVHIVPREQDALGSSILPASASVFIKYSPEVDMESQVPRIKVLVENSIGGLKRENVSVFLFQSTLTTPPPIERGSNLFLFIGIGVVVLIVLGVAAVVFIQMQQKKANVE